MKKIVGFFDESEGNKSMARLISFIFGLWAVLASGYTLVALKDYAGCIAVFSAVAGIAASFKLIQKQMEVKPQP